MSPKVIPFKERLIGKATEIMIKSIDEAPIIAPVKKKLFESKVAIITTAGVHIKGQELFDTKKGDHTYRLIPSTITPEELMITHGHYDQTEAEKDINCVFPIERLQELKEEGFIGDISTNHFGFMGFTPNVTPLMEETAPEVAKILKEDNVDIAILSPG